MTAEKKKRKKKKKKEKKEKKKKRKKKKKKEKKRRKMEIKKGEGGSKFLLIDPAKITHISTCSLFWLTLLPSKTAIVFKTECFLSPTKSLRQ